MRERATPRFAPTLPMPCGTACERVGDERGRSPSPSSSRRPARCQRIPSSGARLRPMLPVGAVRRCWVPDRWVAEGQDTTLAAAYDPLKHDALHAELFSPWSVFTTKKPQPSDRVVPVSRACAAAALPNSRAGWRAEVRARQGSPPALRPFSNRLSFRATRGAPLDTRAVYGLGLPSSQRSSASSSSAGA